jgi:CubicO group peptidase (beta-lactamase class C family)
MNNLKAIATFPNPDLHITQDNKARWNQPKTRRHGFHNLYRIPRYSVSFRAAKVLHLETNINASIGMRPDVKKMTETNHFSGMVVLKGQELIFERYADDFHHTHPHTIMSISKMTLNLICGELISQGLLDPNKKVKEYLPEIGTGYAEATVQQVLNMDLSNNYSEDYSDPLASSFIHETTLGWRLPSEEIPEINQKTFLSSIQQIGSSLENKTGYADYKSANTDVLAWVAESISKRSLREWMINIVEAIGIEGNWHMHTDRDGFPVVDGGVNLCARDLARFGQLFCRFGMGADGNQIGSKKYIEDTRKNPGPKNLPPKDFYNYSNQTMTNGTWLGHGGYGGQFMLANPDTGISVSFFSVLQNKDALDLDYSVDMVKMMEKISQEY